MCVKRRLAHLCPDGIVQREKRKNSSSTSLYPTSPSATNGDLPSIQATNSSTITSRLDSLERKLDLLLSNRNYSSHSPVPLESGTLHDLASVATDHLNLSREKDDFRRPKGTLSMHADGRSSYVGPNAHSVYLTEEALDSTMNGLQTPSKFCMSRPGSPTPVDLDAPAPVQANAVNLSPQEHLTPLSSDIQGMTIWTTPGFRSPHSSAAIWNMIKSALPDIDTAQRLVNVYYASVSFMHDLVPREEMNNRIWPIFYGDPDQRSSTPPPGFHPHKLSLLLAILALGVLFDVKRPQRDPVGRALYSYAWCALTMSNFTEATSNDALLALLHVTLYLAWRRMGRYSESAWPLLGTMMSMVVRSGLHRDPAHFDLTEAERERRRSVFWDLQGVEVLRSFGLGRPPSILDRHIDTQLPKSWRLMTNQKRPSSAEERAGAFYALKSHHAQLTNRVLDECFCSSSTYPLTLEFDKRIRRLIQSIPSWLLPTIIPLSKRSPNGIADMEATYTDEKAREEMVEEMRCHLININCHQLLLLLHRGWFSVALQDLDQEEQVPSDENKPDLRFQKSVTAVNESACTIIQLITSAWAHYPALVVRWMLFWNGLFSAAVCRGLFAIKQRSGAGAIAAWRDLRTAIALLRHAVDGWKPLEQPLGILLRLHNRAELVLGGAGNSTTKNSRSDSKDTLDDQTLEISEDLELIGEGANRARGNKRKKGRKASTTSSGFGASPDDSILGESGTSKKVRVQSPSTSVSTNDASNTPVTFSTDIMGFTTTPNIPNFTAPSSAPFGIEDTNGSLGLSASLFSSSSMTKPASLPAFALGSDTLNQADMTLLSADPSNSNVFPPTPYRTDVITDTTTPGGSHTPNATQLIQMLNDGAGWDSLSSWEGAIFDL